MTHLFTQAPGVLPYPLRQPPSRLKNWTLSFGPVFSHNLVNVSSVADAKNGNLITFDLKDHPVIADPQFPVSLERSSKGFPVIFRRNHQSCLNSFPYSCLNRVVEFRYVFAFDKVMIADGVGHATPRPLYGSMPLICRRICPVYRRTGQGPGLPSSRWPV